MCGRYALRSPPELVKTLFELGELPPIEARYNIAPGQMVLAVVQRPATAMAHDAAGRPQRLARFLRWGLVPPWADDPAIGNRMINARSESAADKPAFRAALRRRRCLIPADGFYEWMATGRRKQPYFIHRRDGAPLALAGLWEHWRPREPRQADDAATMAAGSPSGDLETCTILTVAANATVKPLHDRMPVIIEPDQWSSWLDADAQDVAPLISLMRPLPDDRLVMHPVSPRVNAPAHDAPDCLAPIDTPPPGAAPDGEPTLFG